MFNTKFGFCHHNNRKSTRGRKRQYVMSSPEYIQMGTNPKTGINKYVLNPDSKPLKQIIHAL